MLAAAMLPLAPVEHRKYNVVTHVVEISMQSNEGRTQRHRDTETQRTSLPSPFSLGNTHLSVWRTSICVRVRVRVWVSVQHLNEMYLNLFQICLQHVFFVDLRNRPPHQQPELFLPHPFVLHIIPVRHVHPRCSDLPNFVPCF